MQLVGKGEPPEFDPNSLSHGLKLAGQPDMLRNIDYIRRFQLGSPTYEIAIPGLPKLTSQNPAQGWSDSTGSFSAAHTPLFKAAVDRIDETRARMLEMVKGLRQTIT